MRIFRLYLWSGLTQCNQILSGTIISRTENEAIHQLISQSITPVSLRCHRRLVYSYKEKQYLPHFTQQLATLLISGLRCYGRWYYFTMNVAFHSGNR